jgi:hypothetical protein
LEKSTMDWMVSKPQKTFHSSKTFFTQSLTCLLTLQPPYLHFSFPYQQLQEINISK